MWRRLSQTLSRNRWRHQKNCWITSWIRWENPHQRRKSQSFSWKRRMENALRKQNRRNRWIKSFERCWMGRRIRITRLSLIRYRKSKDHHRWSHESLIFLIKRKHRLRLSFLTLQKTRQNPLQKIILVKNFQLISLNHFCCPHPSRLIRCLKSHWLMW